MRLLGILIKYTKNLYNPDEDEAAEDKCQGIRANESMYSETWEIWTPKGLWKTVLNSEVVLYLRSISIYWIGLGTEVAVLNFHVVPISQVVLKAGFTVLHQVHKYWNHNF